MLQSTAVMDLPRPSGMIQARPTGSGSLEIRISLGKTSVQFNRTKVSSSIYRALSPLSKYTPFPTFPVCINRMPSSAWSLLSIQSPSANTVHTCSTVAHLVSSPKLNRFCAQRGPDQSTSAIRRLHRFIYTRQPLVIGFISIQETVW